MKISGIDHLVLTVQSIDMTCRFYCNLLGFEKRIFGNDRVALHFGTQKINLHQADRPVDQNVLHGALGSADICLITETPIEVVVNYLNDKSIKIIEGPVVRTGARGPIHSVYIYDPDENLLEIAKYKKE